MTNEEVLFVPTMKFGCEDYYSKQPNRKKPDQIHRSSSM